jgi:uncharacterized protein (DUF3820 family)
MNTIAQWNNRLKSNEYTQYRMPWGRYRNVMIKDIPIDYIKWGIMNLKDEFAEKFARELARRESKWRKI